MRFTRLMVLSVLLSALMAGGGCSTSQQTRRVTADDSASPHLVMPTQSMIDLAAAEQGSLNPQLGWDQWTSSRNDDLLGSPMPDFATAHYLEVRQRDYQRTINGRPREFSTTYTTTITRGINR